jgi:hypothetical protein
MDVDVADVVSLIIPVMVWRDRCDRRDKSLVRAVSSELVAIVADAPQESGRGDQVIVSFQEVR